MINLRDSRTWVTDTNQLTFPPIPEYKPPPNCTISFSGYDENGKETQEKFDLKEMRAKQEQLESENQQLRLRLQKLETWFDHIRQKSSIIDEFIKIAESIKVE